LEMAQKEYLQVVADLRRAEVELGLMKSKNAKMPSNHQAAVEELFSKDLTLQSYRNRADKLENLLLDAKATNPSLETIKVWTEDLKEIKKKVEDRTAQLTALAEEQLKQTAREEWQAKLSEQSERIEFLTSLKATLKADIDRLTKETEDQGKLQEPKILHLEKEIRELRATIEELKKRK
jgi:hypothetical protein